MRIYKCDICKKELKESEVQERYVWDRKLDLCSECHDTYNKAEKEINDMRQELKKKFEGQFEEKTKLIMKKYKINIWEEENEKESI